MDELKHNQELIKAVADLYNNKVIRKDKDIADRTGYSKSTVSGYISGKVLASDDFLKEFENKFEIRLSDYQKPTNGAAPDPRDTPLTGAHVTLQDHIDLLKDYNEKLFALLSSNLGNLQEGQRIMIAYQKAWVDHAAQQESGDDPDRKEEIKYRFGKLVDDILSRGSLSGSQTESGKTGKV